MRAPDPLTTKAARKRPAPKPSLAPGIGPAIHRRAPAPKPQPAAPRRAPGIGAAAPQPKRKVVEAGREQRAQIPGVGPATAKVPEHLAKHRINRARREEAQARGLGQAARQLLSAVSPLVVGPPQLHGQAKLHRDPLAMAEGLTSLGSPGILYSGIKALAGDSAPYREQLSNLEGTGAWQGLSDAITGHFKGHDPVLHTLGPWGQNAEQGLTAAARDAINLPAQAIPSAYLPLRDIAQGHVGRAVNRVAQPYADFASDPAGFVKQHPLGAYLMFAGGKAAVGRTAGAAARGAGRVGARTGSETLRAVGRAGQTYRGSAVVPGTKIEVAKHYSPDITIKARQVLQERYGPKAGQRKMLLSRAQEAEKAGKIDEAATLQRQAARLDPLRVSEGNIRQHVDAIVGAAEQFRREHRDAATGNVNKIVKSVPRAQRGALRVVAEGVVRGNREDIAKYIGELKQVHDEAAAKLTGKEVRQDSLLRANRLLRTHLEKALTGSPEAFNKLRRAAGEYGHAGRELEQQLVRAQMLDERQAEKAALIPAASRRLGAKLGVADGWQGIVDADGNPLTLEHLRRMRADELQLGDVMFSGGPAFVTQAPRMGGGKNFYKPFYPRTGPRSIARSGEAVRIGALEADPKVLVEQHARMQGLLDADRSFRDFVNYMGYRKDGQVAHFDKYDDAAHAADQLAHDTGVTWRPVRIDPLGSRSKEMIHGLLEDTKGDPIVEGDVTHAMHEALSRHQTGEGRWALAPDAAAEQLQAHLGSLRVNVGKRVARQLNSGFRKAVLSTNPKWLYGNAAEAFFRTVLQHGFNPVDVYLSVRHIRAVVKEMRDPSEARALEASGLKDDAAQLRKSGQRAADELATYGWQGGLYQGAGSFQVIHNRSDRYPEGSAIRKLAEGADRLHDVPGVALLPRAWDWWTRKVFIQLNGTMERAFQQTMAGKESRRMVGAQRDTEMFDPASTARITSTAIQDAARGLKSTPAQIELGQRVMRAYGQYHSWGPSFRALMENYTPFLAWTWNSFRFLTSVLPKDHPIFTGLLASAEINAQPWLRAHGLDWFASRSKLPDFLQGTIPTGGGAHVNVGRYLPFGFGADPLSTVAGNVLPQYSAPLLALTGKDWKGANLPKADPISRLKAAALSFAGAEVPFVGQAQQIQQGGRGIVGGLERLVDPFPEIKRKGAAPGAGAPGTTFNLGTVGGSFNHGPATSGASGGTTYNVGP